MKPLYTWKPMYMWAGGKNKMLKHYSPSIPKVFTSYHEPFFGAGALFVRMYEQSPKSHFYINDINSDLMGIYHAIKSDLPTFLKYIMKLESEYLPLLPPPSKKDPDYAQEKKRIKELENDFKDQTAHNNPIDWQGLFKKESRKTRRSFYFKTRSEYHQSKWSPSRTAATLYFLMKTGFNGVWQAGGPKRDPVTGLYEKDAKITKATGKFNTPCGLLNHKGSLIDVVNISMWHEALKRTTITSHDFSKTLENVSAGDFVFLDPPYRSGKDEETFADYGTRLDDDFQESVIRYLLESASKGATSWLSNREHGDNWFQDRCGSTCDIKTFDVTYTVGRRKAEYDEVGNIKQHHAKKAKEVLIIGKPLADKEKGNG